VSDELVLALAQIALALVLATAACVVVRRRVIARRGGIVECCLRSAASGRWQHGLAEYRSGQLHWHRSLSLRVRPHAAFDRRYLVVMGSRPAGAREAAWLGPETVIVTCQDQPVLRRPRGSRRPGSWPPSSGPPSSGPRDSWTGGSRPAGRARPPEVRLIELAMSHGALTGYLAWLEGAPAGYLSDAS
jgi:hypothetical protein